ncbi:MAG: B12-binding domain-containing radical SAM protein, partial [Planctomycetota bacterium]
ATWLKEDPDLGTCERLIGGIHPSLAPDEILKEGLFDIIVTGEGEGAIADYCRLRSEGRSIREVPNLWGREEGVEFRNERRPLADLDSIPIVAREDFDYLNLHHERKGAASIMAGRGCPFECRYCCNHALKALNKGLGQYTRFRSVDHVLSEIKGIQQLYPNIERIAFEDDVLPLYPKWFKEFCKKYPKEIGLPYSCNLHPGLAKPEVADALVASGCIRVNVGLESGNEKIRQEVLGRRLNLEAFIGGMDRLRDAGLTICANSILGIPGEGMAEMLDTVKLNARIGSTVHPVYIFYPFPKTQLYEQCRNEGLLTGEVRQDFLTKSVLKMDPLLRRRVEFMRDHFYRLVGVYRRLQSGGRLGAIGSRLLDALLCHAVSFGVIQRGIVPAVQWVKKCLGAPSDSE